MLWCRDNYRVTKKCDLNKGQEMKITIIVPVLFIVFTFVVGLAGCSSTLSPKSSTETMPTPSTTTMETITNSRTIATTLTQITSTSSPVTSTTWNLNLQGVITENIDQTLFAEGATTDCHGTFWTDTEGNIWSGIPLWMLAAYVDDNVTMGPPNVALWSKGFEVEVIASDGSFVDFTSAQILNNNNVLVASEINGKPLPNSEWPLALVGIGVDQQHQIGGIISIKLILPSATASGLSTTP